MSPCQFQFNFRGSSEGLLEKIRSRVSAAGGSLTGSSDGGTFSLPTPLGPFRGSYRVELRTIFLEVSDRPFFVSCGAIEATLASYLKA